MPAGTLFTQFAGALGVSVSASWEVACSDVFAGSSRERPPGARPWWQRSEWERMETAPRSRALGLSEEPWTGGQEARGSHRAQPSSAVTLGKQVNLSASLSHLKIEAMLSSRLSHRSETGGNEVGN